MNTFARLCLAALLAGVLLPSCMHAPLDQQAVAAKNELVHFDGYTDKPLKLVSIQALNRATSSWVQIAQTMTSPQATTDNKGLLWYHWMIDVRLPSDPVYWARSGSRLLIQTRSVSNNTPLATFAVGANECAQRAYDTGGGAAAMQQCASPRTPVAELQLSCGANGQACCSSHGASAAQLCNAGLACSNERCTPCGGVGQVCCPNNGCNNTTANVCHQGFCADRLDIGMSVEPLYEACPPSGTIQKVLDLIDDVLPTVDTDSSALCGSFETEVTAGTRLNRASPSFSSWTADTFHIGGDGELAANQMLCLLRDLERNPDRSVTVQGPSVSTPFGSLGVRHKLGYLNYTPSQRAVDGYQSLNVCLPLVGCFDAQQAKWNARVIETAIPDGGTAVDREYALRFKTEQSDYHYEMTLGPFPVMTPIGPINITPAAQLNTQIEGYMGAYAPPPAGAFTNHVPATFSIKNPVPLIDMHGRAGLPWVMASRAPVGLPLRSHGWFSDMVIGGRSGNPSTPLWNAPGRNTTTIPDFDVAIPRSIEENTPTVDFHVQAEIKYDAVSVARNLNPLSGVLSIDELSVTVTPKLDAYYAGQTQLSAAEYSFENLEFRGDHATSTVLQTGASASASIGIGANVRLVISVGPFSKTFNASTEYRPTIPLGTPAVKRGSGLAGGAFVGAPTGKVTTLRPFTFDQNAVVNTCLAAPTTPAGTVPPPTFTPAPNPRIDVVAPCNICVDYAQNGATKFTRIIPIGTPNWTCDAQRVGCMDVCEVNQTSGGLTRIKESATAMNYSKCGLTPPQ